MFTIVSLYARRLASAASHGCTDVLNSTLSAWSTETTAPTRTATASSWTTPVVVRPRTSLRRREYGLREHHEYAEEGPKERSQMIQYIQIFLASGPSDGAPGRRHASRTAQRHRRRSAHGHTSVSLGITDWLGVYASRQRRIPLLGDQLAILDSNHD